MNPAVSSVDAAKLPVMLNSLRLPSINRLWQQIAADAKGKISFQKPRW